MRGALTSVVASIATHSRPKCRLIVTRVIVDRNPSRHAVNSASGVFSKRKPSSGSADVEPLSLRRKPTA
jgi:hypothetical protein